MASAQTRVPPLVAGDKLTLEEFLQRWAVLPAIKRAELIGGIVYLPSPVSIEHGDFENLVATWLGVYAASTLGCTASNNATTVVNEDSPQPDVHLRLLPEVGGRTRQVDNLLHGAPEMVAEVCLSSTAYDLHQKLELYQSSQVFEYLAVLLLEQEIRWHRLVDGRYERLAPDDDGTWRSILFPGLWLNGMALLTGNAPQVLATLQQGLHSEEHRAFVAELHRRRTPNKGS